VTGRRRVVVTGLGVVSPLGHRVEELWRGLAAGQSAVAAIRRFDAAGFPTRIAAESAEPERPESIAVELWRGASRIERFALAAASTAVADAELLDAGARGGRERFGLALAAGLGSFTHREVFAPCAAGAGAAGFDLDRFAAALGPALGERAAERRSPGNLAARLASELGLAGPLLSVDTACAAGTQALGDAARWIRLGIVDTAVAVATDSQLSPLGLASFCLLRVLSTRNNEPRRASRPFDAGRDGFVMGEGAGALVVEELGAAERRGARIYGEIVGFGSACDAYRVTDPHPEGLGAVLAMRRALADAGVEPGAVGYLNAHGTSTPANDRLETRAIHRVFGEAATRLPVSSTKSMIGHLTVAAGAVEAIATLGMLREQRLHPTLNLDERDPDCDLDYVAHVARASRLEYALSNSFGFGGQCASLLLRRWSA
jgi:3-oxoacyl-[acyl-carrier-protein] synthase II